MSLNQPIVIGNWKMNCSTEQASNLLVEMAQISDVADIKVAVCPSTIHIPLAAERLTGSPVLLGAQDVSALEFGARTGETSGACLREFGVEFCLVGHSERRHLLAESNDVVQQKFATAYDSGLTPVLCVGETIDEKNNGFTFDVIKEQLNSAFAGVEAREDCSFFVAYEPVWSIGTGLVPDKESIKRVHDHIRTCLQVLGGRFSALTSILYGGSVNSRNVREILPIPNVDGVLVGGASLNSKEFTEICLGANRTEQV